MIANTGDDNLNVTLMLDANKAYRLDEIGEVLAGVDGLELKEVRDFRNEPEDTPKSGVG